MRECKGHTGIVDALAFSPDGKLLASGSADKTVRLWNPQDGKEIKSLPGHKESVYTRGLQSQWPTAGLGQQRHHHQDLGREGPKGNQDVRHAAQGAGKACSQKEGRKEKGRKEDEPKKEEPKKQILEFKELPEGVTGVVFTPDNKEVLSVGFDKKLHYWSVADGKELKKLPPTPDDLFGLALSRDGKYVATAGYGGSLRVYEIASGKEIFKQQLPKMVTYCVQFTPDGKALVTGHERDFAARVTPLSKQ